MAIELPGPVADFLNFIGINWPSVNEDDVRAFGQHVKQFADQLQQIHQFGTDTVTEVGQSYQGESYDKLFAVWGAMSQQHMTVLLDGCYVLSTALDVGADVIVGEKLAAIAQLVVMAAEFIADQAAAAATFGLAEAAVALIEEQGEMVVNFLEQEIEQYVEAQLINAAVGPLVQVVDQVVDGLVYQGTAALLGEQAPSSGAGAPQIIHIDPSAVLGLAEKFAGNGDEAQANGEQLHASVSSLSFED